MKTVHLTTQSSYLTAVFFITSGSRAQWLHEHCSARAAYMVRGILDRHLWQIWDLNTVLNPSPTFTGSWWNGWSRHHGILGPSCGAIRAPWSPAETTGAPSQCLPQPGYQPNPGDQRKCLKLMKRNQSLSQLTHPKGILGPSLPPVRHLTCSLNII